VFHETRVNSLLGTVSLFLTGLKVTRQHWLKQIFFHPFSILALCSIHVLAWLLKKMCCKIHISLFTRWHHLGCLIRNSYTVDIWHYSMTLVLSAIYVFGHCISHQLSQIQPVVGVRRTLLFVHVSAAETKRRNYPNWDR
jgi:hypothetical protein